MSQLVQVFRSVGAALMCVGTAASAASMMRPGDPDWRTVVAGVLIWVGARLVFLNDPQEKP